ncbi:hypothetical protein JNUCC1_00880 [Lentibacillus sp. JNUCC-1]|uniref:hypothetical protein n=1 Tax=Lentibacillus sp. JNUCC-1 TaxID=2654513 RepID=UPI0012E8C5B3|nr:hypothetical protein [Lentibacillus sp. JNUCC-1]MUV37074.1 hypothetical protein [Lentibacillus sp. JNUCC-1]
MKKTIEGAVYNTKTAQKICERFTHEPKHEKGANVKQLQQLFRTRSNKFFFYVKSEFTTPVVVNNDDIFPEFEEQEVIDEQIIPVSYEKALQFASEISADSKSEKNMIRKYFPELVEGQGEKKIQKKLYLSEKANWYLELMLQEGTDTNSSLVEKLITEEYRRLYKQGIMIRDPFSEMDD